MIYDSISFMKLVKFVGFDGCWCNLKTGPICLSARALCYRY